MLRWNKLQKTCNKKNSTASPCCRGASKNLVPLDKSKNWTNRKMKKIKKIPWPRSPTGSTGPMGPRVGIAWSLVVNAAAFLYADDMLLIGSDANALHPLLHTFEHRNKPYPLGLVLPGFGQNGQKTLFRHFSNAAKRPSKALKKPSAAPENVEKPSKNLPETVKKPLKKCPRRLFWGFWHRKGTKLGARASARPPLVTLKGQNSSKFPGTFFLFFWRFREGFLTVFHNFRERRRFFDFLKVFGLRRQRLTSTATRNWTPF